MFSRIGKTARLAAAAAGALLMVCLAGGGTLAAPTSYLLQPGAGSIATGAGTVVLDPTMSPLSIQFTLAGAHPTTTYNVAACSTVYGCSPSGASFTTDITGSFTGAVVTAYPVSLDTVVATDSGAASDFYLAFVNAGPFVGVVGANNPGFGSPAAGAFFVGTTPTGPLYVSAGGTVLGFGGLQLGPQAATFPMPTLTCPPGYAGQFTFPTATGFATVSCPGQ